MSVLGPSCKRVQKLFSADFLGLTKGGPGRESCTEGRLVSSLGNPLKFFFLGGHMIFVQLWHAISISQTPVATAKCSVQARVPSLLLFSVGKICNNILRICSHYLA